MAPINTAGFLLLPVLLLMSPRLTNGQCGNAASISGCSISADCLDLTCKLDLTPSVDILDVPSIAISGDLHFFLCAATPFMQLELTFDDGSSSQLIAYNVTSAVQIPITSFDFATTYLEVDFSRNLALETFDISLGLEFEVSDGIGHKDFGPFSFVQNLALPNGPAVCSGSDDDSVSGGQSQAAELRSCTLSHRQRFWSTAGILIHTFGLISGLFSCFFGYRYFKIMLFMSGFVVAGVISFAIAYEELTITPASHLELAAAGIAVGAGLAGGLTIMCLFYVGIFLIGAILGFLIFVFFVIAIHQSAFLVAHLTVTYVMAGIISVGGGVLALFMQKIIIVLSTACAGAFGVMAAVDYFAQEGRALLEIKAATSSSITEPAICWYSYMTFIIWPVFFIGGTVVQFRWTSRNFDHRRPGKRTILNISGRRGDKDDLELLLPAEDA